MFELNNILNKNYTGVFSVSLSATFYAPTHDFPEANSADVSLPLTTGSATGSQMLVYPGDTRRTLEIPLNAAEAYLEIIATGAAEEVSDAICAVSSFPARFTLAGSLTLR